MSEDFIDDLAYGIVEDYLEDGPEFIDIVEAVDDNSDSDNPATDEQYQAVAARVREYLAELAKKF